MSSAAAAKVKSLIAGVVEHAGLDLEDVVVRSAGRRQIVQVLVDRDGGIDLDTVADVSRACSDALDTVDLFGGAYDLEVGSPGVDRPLTEPRHWRRNKRRLVQARLRDGKEVTGRIVSTDDEGIVLSIGTNERTIPYADLVRGTVQVEFTRLADDDAELVDHDDDDEEAAR